MKKKRVILATTGAAVVVAAALFVIGGSKKTDDAALGAVKVSRGEIVEKALAVGTIEPENEISIKSKVSGVVARILAEPGSFVKAGQPLLEVRPDPSPLELADAKRQVQLADVELANLEKERRRQKALVEKQLISQKDYESFDRDYESSVLRQKIAREKLALMESGRVKIENTEIESIVKAPIDGYVLSKTVEVGDPVTPLTSYQEGTVLMKMANMSRLLFKGTVDEIDVGKLKEGMIAEIKVGALPADTIQGSLSKISLKGEKKENATVFPIEVTIPTGGKATLRAGYSANVNVIVQRKASVLMIPERVVTFRNDSAFVNIPVAQKPNVERCIKTGLSDAVNIEVVTGLSEGDSVAEKPVKKIE